MRSAGKTGSCFPDERANGPQCALRIPLPHQGKTFLCAALRELGLPNLQMEGLFMSKFSAKTVCRVAILAAIYFLLNMVSVRAGNLRITFASLPVVVCGLLFGPVEAMLTAFFGELLNQMLSYGFTATTLLWLIPPAVRGVLIGVAAVHLRSRGRPLEERPIACYAVCVIAALATTLANTGAIAADALIYHYFKWPLLYATLALRLFTGEVTAVIVATAAMPLTGLLRRHRLARA